MFVDWLCFVCIVCPLFLNLPVVLHSPPAPGYSRERTSPNERPDESKRHTLSGPPTRNYSSDEKVDEHSLSVNTTPEEVSRSERIKEVEVEKEKKSKVRN